MKSIVKTFVVVAGTVALAGMLGSCKSTKAPEKPGLMAGRGMIPPAYANSSDYVSAVHAPRSSYIAPRETTPVQEQESVSINEDDSFEKSPDFVNESVKSAETVSVNVSEPVSTPVLDPLSPVTSAQSAVAAAEGKTYTVKKGDTLSHIAVAHGVKWQEIASLNPSVDPNKMHEGTVLTLPDYSKPTPAGGVSHVTSKKTVSRNSAKTDSKQVSKSKTPKAQKAVPADGIYVAVSGDSLWTIARDFGVSINDLKSWNNLSSDKVSVGQKFVVNGKATKSISTPVKKVESAAPGTETAPAVKEEEPVLPPDEAPVKTVVETPADDASADLTVVDDEAVVDNSIVAPEAELENTLKANVNEGDTIESICTIYGITEEVFKKANPAIQSDADLKPGDVIYIKYRQ